MHSLLQIGDNEEATKFPDINFSEPELWESDMMTSFEHPPGQYLSNGNSKGSSNIFSDTASNEDDDEEDKPEMGASHRENTKF